MIKMIMRAVKETYVNALIPGTIGAAPPDPNCMTGADDGV